MKFKTRVPCRKPSVSDNDDKNFTATKITPTPSSPSPPHESSLLQTHSSLQTLPSVPSLQSLLLDDVDDLTLTRTLSSSFSLSSSITSLSISPSTSSSTSSSLLYASAGHQINVYDCATLTLVDTFNGDSPSSGAVKSIAFCNGKVLTAHQDGKIRVWKLTEKLLETKTSEQKHKQVATLPTLSDRLMHYPIPKNHVQVRRHKTRLWLHHNDAVSSLAVTPTAIYSASWDKTLKIWGPLDLKCKSSVTASQDAVNAVTVSADGVVYTASAEGLINVWNNINNHNDIKKMSGGLSLIATLEKHKSAVNALALNKDETVLFSGACDRSILVWERVDGGKYMSVSGALRGHGGAILSLVNIGDFLVSGSADRTVRIWRRGGGKFKCLAVLTGHKKAVKCLAGKMVEGGNGIVLFSGGLDGEIRVWNVVRLIDVSGD
ncbi:hypothetical protein RND81_11G010600 [Saponaria officinalis]|uniref:Uncharacterized protein n=1 Tax=Saponaria officinalis TaxID=3572 RepID=A0AAW1HIA0_SAPOF